MSAERFLESVLSTGVERKLRIWALASMLVFAALILGAAIFLGTEPVPLPGWGALLIGLIVLNLFVSFISVMSYVAYRPIAPETPIFKRLGIWQQRIFIPILILVFLYAIGAFIVYPLYLRSQMTNGRGQAHSN